ncbi:MAG: FAD-dependent oxidoreductase [Chthonomonadaceae bacterium]|uniref:D-amino-acid oxidase n=1 Tax=Candidatus Nitrosymbiomonas proteolyticus TaxID=2608984 RepID=A0A809SEB3_9BACT|nr:D-amino-acid oxidase [Candidatus Nitrosymbiomonas proteolyticus]
MSPAQDVLVVGAGIVGAAVARELALRGLSVAVVDSRPPGLGATSAGMGHLVVLDGSEAEFQLCRRSMELWDRLLPDLPSDCQARRPGTFWVAVGEDELALVARKASYYLQHGVEVEALDAKSALEAEPALRRDVSGALFVPGDAVIYPPAAARWLLENGPKGKVSVLRGRVIEIGEGRARMAGGEELSFRWGVLAGGCANDLMPALPLEPKKGHLAITDSYPGLIGRQLIEIGYGGGTREGKATTVAFNAQPRSTGQILIGSSRQFVGDDTSLDRKALGLMLKRACEYLPILAELEVIRTWVGFRAATPDHLPILSEAPNLSGWWVAAGHEGLGITTSLASGELIADLLLGAGPTLDPAPYSVRRFARG